LDIGGNDVGAEGGASLGALLGCSTASLKELYVRWNRIGAVGLNGCDALAAGLGENASLTLLDVGTNELYDEGAAAFALALKHNCTLTEINLERNEIHSEGACAIAGALETNVSLHSLILSGNDVGESGGVALGKSLVKNITTLQKLVLINCGIGPAGGVALGEALAVHKSLEVLRLDKNALGSPGAIALAKGLKANQSLQTLYVSRNRMGEGAGAAFADALQSNATLSSLDISENQLCPEDGRALFEAVARSSSLSDVNLADNFLTSVPIESQWVFARRMANNAPSSDIAALTLDLSGNPLSSPPLGRRGDPGRLQEYFQLLVSEPAAVARFRLMVLGFGGVGKSTFCRFATSPNLQWFHSSLIPLDQWSVDDITAWARRVGSAEFSGAAAQMLEQCRIRGKDLGGLVASAQAQHSEDSGDHRPSALLQDMAARANMSHSEVERLARAIGALLKKGYLSTVGAVKVEGTLTLGGEMAASSTSNGTDEFAPTRRECSLVDFAGQMYVCMYVCMCMYVYMYVCMYVCVHVFMYVCMYVMYILYKQMN
jgi:Ran GTPase-activating protein (RanGAP) involved in mRNA processing and transport